MHKYTSFEFNFENSHIGIWDWPDINSDFVYWSKRMFSILHIDPQNEKPSLNLYFDLVHPEDRSLLKQALENHLKFNEPFNLEYRINVNDGATVWIESSGNSIRDSAGNAVSMSGVIVDISRRKKIELENKETLRILKIAESVSGSGSVKYNISSGEMWISEGARTILGIKSEMPLRINDFIDRIYEQDLANFIVELNKSNESLGLLSVIFRHKDRPNKYFKISSYNYAELGVSNFFYGTISDITELIEKENYLNDLIANLSRSNQDLEYFAYIASHDLQEPLRKIQTFGDRLLQKAETFTAIEQDYVQRMQNSANRMAKLLKDLLDYSKLIRGNEYDESCDLNSILGLVLNDLEDKIEATNCKVTISKLPIIHGNASQLYRLFMNLISNSIKFRTHDKSPIIEVSYSQVRSDKPIELESDDKILDQFHEIKIIDNGIGFEPEYQDKIFTIFSRLNPKEKFSGTGIGLAVCRKIMEQHGGTIQASSQLSEGSVFTIVFPYS